MDNTKKKAGSTPELEKDAGYIIQAYDNNTTFLEDLVNAAEKVFKIDRMTAIMQFHEIERKGAGQIGPVYEERLNAQFHCDGFTDMVAKSGNPVEAEVIKFGA